MKIILKVVGVLILLAVFVAVYTIVTNLNNEQRFQFVRQSVGTLGGYHLLQDIRWDDQGSFYRVSFKTDLNRDSILESQIKTPYTEVIPETKDDPILFGDGERLLPELGDYHLVVNLSDTRQFDLSGDTAEPVFEGSEQQIINEGSITEIRVHQPPDDSLQQVLIGLNRPAPFRLHVDPNNTGIVWLDILE
ncbi:MAG: hypothetical protein KJ844_11530 [Candidatus Edwardsbacteria bacterium]|nr:hypothetical protein [Candidatus Edwardsbacteria bacterium]